MKKLIIIILFLPVFLLGQDKFSDERISKAKGRDKVILLIEAADATIEKDYYKSLHYAKLALYNARKIEDQNLIRDSYFTIGLINKNHNHYNEAYQNLMAAYRSDKENENLRGLSQTSSHLGDINKLWAEYEKALKFYFESLEVSELLKDDLAVATSLANIAVIHNFWKNYDKSIQYYHKSLNIYKKKNNEEGIASALLGLGTTHYNMNSFDVAQDYYERSLAIYKKLNNTEKISYCYNNLGNIYETKHDYLRAANYFRQAYSLIKDSNKPYPIATTLLNLGSIERKLKNYELAISLFDESIKIAQKAKINETLKNAYLLKAQLYEENGQLGLAIANYKKYDAIKDTIFNNSSGKLIAEQEARYNTQAKEEAYQVLKKDNELQRTQQNLIIAILILVLFIAFVLYRNNRQKKSINNELSNKNIEINNRKEELERALEDLRKSEIKLTSLFNNAIAGISLIDNEGYFIYLNETWSRMLGFDAEEIHQMNLFDLVYTDDVPDARRHFKDFVEGNIHEYRMETRFNRKNGNRFWADVSVSPIYDFEGNLESIVFVVINIDLRKRKSLELERQYKFLQVLIDTIPQPIYYKDTKGVYLGANRAYEQRLNLSRKQIIGKTVFDIMPLDPAEDFHKQDLELIKNPGINQYEANFIQNGKHVYNIVNKATFIDLDGSVAGVVGVITDITYIRHAEKLIKENEDKLRKFIQYSNDGIALIDEEGYITEWNAGYERISGLKKEQVVGKHIWEVQYTLIPEDMKNERTLSNLEDIIKKLNASGEADFLNKALESKLQTPDGQIKYIEGIVFSINTEKGFVLASVSRDVTARIMYEKALKESEEKLRQANIAKDKFFSILAHDLKNPLQAIMLGAHMLQVYSNNNEKEQLKESIVELNDAAKQLSNLLENLLQWARTQNHTIKYQPDYIDINEVIDENIKLISASSEEKNINVIKNTPEDLIAYVDLNMIRTVIRNLLTNAVKFTGVSGTITVEAKETQDNMVVVGIADTGIGIRPEDLDKLFRIDVHHTTIGTRNEEGTGLGLILCKEFIEMNGGKIWVNSEYGKGSTFYFTVPIFNKDDITDMDL